MSITRPNIVQQENRLRSLPDDALRAMLLQMGQSGQVGSPEYLLAAGEMQARKNVRQQAQMGKPQQPPVIAELLTGVPMQGGQQAQPAPEEAGVAGLPAQNLEALDQPQYADGGIVAFEYGGSSRLGLSPDEMETRRLREEIRRRYAFTTSPLGMFSPVAPGQEKAFQERRSGLQDLLKALPNLNKEQLVNLNQALLDQETAMKTAGVPQVKSVAGPDVEAQPGGFYGGAAPTGTTPPAGAPPAADKIPPGGVANLPAAPDYGAIFERAQGIAGQINPLAETAPTIKEAVGQQKRALTEAGFDFNLFKDQIAQVRQEKEQSKEDRKEATNLRLLEAGLGIMAGESPYAFVNIGKGATPALKGLAEDIKDIKKIDRERDKALRDLAVAENQVASGMGLAALKTRESAQDRIARADEARATRTASIFNTLTSAETQRYVANQTVAASKEGKAGDLDSRRYDKAREAAIKLVNEGTTKFATAAEKEAEISRLTAIFYQQALDAASGKVSPATSTPRGRVVNGVYVPAGQ